METQNLNEVLEFLEDNDVRFIRLQFSDLFGENKNIAVSTSEFINAIENGIPFKASVMTALLDAPSDLYLFPDPSTILKLPWRPHQGSVARVLCNICYPTKELYEADSRALLKKTVETYKKQGYTFKIGVKIEFYLLDQESNEPLDQARYFDLAPLDRGEDCRREIILTLEEMGFQILSSHHELGSSQHQIDFKMDDPLTLADNLQTFKTVVKTIAGLNDMHASFMPKPLNDEPGSGMHIEIKAFKNGKNLFESKENALYFASGILSKLPEISAIANPIVNSYKRLNSEFELSASWDPEDKDAVIRIPKYKDNRLILRTPDGASNPYLLLSLLIAAGVSGLKEEKKEEIIKLPENLKQAYQKFSESEFIKKNLGEEIQTFLTEYKFDEYNNYDTTVHNWEKERYFKRI